MNSTPAVAHSQLLFSIARVSSCFIIANCYSLLSLLVVRIFYVLTESLVHSSYETYYTRSRVGKSLMNNFYKPAYNSLTKCMNSLYIFSYLHVHFKRMVVWDVRMRRVCHYLIIQLTYLWFLYRPNSVFRPFKGC